MVCTKCGANNPEGSVFCFNCGNSLNNVNQNMTMNNSQIQSNQSTEVLTNSVHPQGAFMQGNNNSKESFFKKNKKILFIVGAILLVAIIAVVVALTLGSKKGNAKDDLFAEDNLIRVTKDDKYGYIDSNGKFAIDPIYEYGTEFYGDYAFVAMDAEVDGKTKRQYLIIDKSGKVKLTVENSNSAEYEDEYNVWIIDDQLYDSSLKKLSSDDVKVKYDSDGYFSWWDTKVEKAGIMTYEGKITYTYKFVNGEDYLGIDPSENEKIFKEKYCRVTIDNKKYGIVNCDTGKVVYDYTDKYILNEENNIFAVKSNNKSVSLMYIQNDKIVYQTSSDNVDIYYSGSEYITISDDDKSYSEMYSYIDISTGQITNKKPSSSSSTNNDLEEWEEHTKIYKFYESGGYGLKTDSEEIIPCEWSNFEFFDIDLYDFLSSKGKKYVLAKKDGKLYLLNLKDGKTEAEFNARYIMDYDDSTFIYYTDIDTDKDVIYNLLTGKSMSVSSDTDYYIRSNYVVIEDGDKSNYYNTDLKLIYTEE